jgi:multicomponent K+:H+ antiporter subunit G
MTPLFEIAISALLLIGGVFGLIGSFGLWRLRNPLQRLHAPTKAGTLGVGAVLMASVLHMWVFQGQLTWQELLIAVFVFVTAPVSALFMAKVHLHLTVQRADVPPTGVGSDWATYDVAKDAHPPFG